MSIPFVVEARPDTGLHNARLGMWLFLASEAMLFGGLFSAYALLRAGAPEWPHGQLGVPLGLFNTAVLLVSSFSMKRACAAARSQDRGGHRMWLGITLALAIVFLAVKGVEYREHIAAGQVPATSTFFAIYYTLTGVHALHLVGGIAVMMYLLGPGSRLWVTRQGQFANRVEATGLYWYFVDVVWVIAFVLLYLS